MPHNVRELIWIDRDVRHHFPAQFESPAIQIIAGRVQFGPKPQCVE
jgi:hypothetical protein